MAAELEKNLSASDCPACWEELGEIRVPYSLTCGHTLCFMCVKRLGQNSPTFHCPLCKELVPLRSVKRNITLHQLLSQLKSTTSAGAFNSALTTSFDSIKLEQLLDRGASGEVHRGVWQNNDVAVKIFASGQITPQVKESFRREVCVMNSLRHPNVVLLLAACPEPPRLAIVMEYVKAGSLYSHLYIDKTPLELQDMVKLLIDISRGLQYLHSINVLHRDLKSKNVLLSAPPPNGQAKLCDFGLARMRLESATMTGNIGTVHWTAPEVLNCARYHFAADVYGLGMVMYEIIARAIPFGGLPPPVVIVAVLLRREMPKIPAGCNEDLSLLVKRCIAWEPNERPSISALLNHLYSLLAPETLPSRDDSSDDVLFNHTHSLGHVVVEVDLDETDIDSDLLEFLIANQQSDDEQDSRERNREADNEKEEREDLVEANDLDSPLFLPTSGGVISNQELDNISKLPSSRRRTSYGSYRTKIVDGNSAEYGGPAYVQQQQRPPAIMMQNDHPNSSQLKTYSVTPNYPKLHHVHSNQFNAIREVSPELHDQQGLPKISSVTKRKTRETTQKIAPSHPLEELPPPSLLHSQTNKVRFESGGLMSLAEGMDNNESMRNQKMIDYSRSTSNSTQSDSDYELAQTLMRQEQQAAMVEDYKIASRLQNEYNTSNAPLIRPPKPPPPPPFTYLPQLPIRPTTKQLLLSQLSTLGRYRKLKPVRTVEKRGVRIGRVVGGETNQWTVQNEIRHFQHDLLNKVELKEPPPPYPVGRVLETEPTVFVKTMVKRLNLQVQSYNKKLLRHVSLVEKCMLPSAEEIEKEKKESQAIHETDMESMADVVFDTSVDSKGKTVSAEEGNELETAQLLENVELQENGTSSKIERGGAEPVVKSKKLTKNQTKKKTVASLKGVNDDSKQARKTGTTKLTKGSGKSPIHTKAIPIKRTSSDSSEAPLPKGKTPEKMLTSPLKQKVSTEKSTV